jgi:hypothetical protein
MKLITLILLFITIGDCCLYRSSDGLYNYNLTALTLNGNIDTYYSSGYFRFNICGKINCLSCDCDTAVSVFAGNDRPRSSIDGIK